MIRKIMAAAAVLSVLSAAIFGMAEKKTYTNLSAEPDFMKYFRVAELHPEVADAAVEQMRKNLPESNMILRVTSSGERDFLFQAFRQKVRVEEVYKGDGINAGDEIFIIDSSWFLVFDNMSANISFVNWMQEGKEYLVFVEGALPLLDKKTPYPVYLLTESIVAPIFCYEDFENVIAPVSGETTYVDYAPVAHNEFFAASEETLEKMLALKQEMITRYPR